MKKKLVILLLFLFLNGCCYRPVSIDKEFLEIKNENIKKTSLPISRKQHETLCSDSSDIEILKELQDGLSRNRAVAIALVNNKDLQAQFENLGISKSDYTQAGLFSNPGFTGNVGIPHKTTELVDEFEGILLFSLDDLWTIPLKKLISMDKLKITQLNILNKIVSIIKSARNAYDKIMFYKAQLKITHDVIYHYKMFKKKFYKDIKSNTKPAEKIQMYHTQHMLNQKIAHIEELKGKLKSAFSELNQILGLKNTSNKPIKIINKIDQINTELPSLKSLIQSALDNRIELQIAKMSIKQNTDALNLEYATIFKNVQTGIDLERDDEGAFFAGPVLTMPLPIFDYNQAQISKAKYQIELSKKNLIATKITIESQVNQLYAQILGTAKKINIYKKHVIPLIHKATELKKKHFEKKITFNSLLQSYMEENQERFTYFEMLYNFLNLYAQLEQAVGRRLDIKFSPKRPPNNRLK